jgi:PKHD-type hydroxylase
MILNNYYYYFINALSQTVCEDIIAYGLQKIYKEKRLGIKTKALTTGGKEKNTDLQKPLNDLTYDEIKSKNLEVKDHYIRDSEITWLNDTWIYDILLPFINEANINAGWNFQLSAQESVQFTVYKPGGFYGWHYDGESDAAGSYKRYFEGVTPVKRNNDSLPPQYVKQSNFIGNVRKISMTCNLNKPDDYKGGNLKFDFGPHSENINRFKECEEIRPQGSIIVFPSFVYHCVTPVTEGERYSLVLWNLGRPFK